MSFFQSDAVTSHTAVHTTLQALRSRNIVDLSHICACSCTQMALSGADACTQGNQGGLLFSEQMPMSARLLSVLVKPPASKPLRLFTVCDKLCETNSVKQTQTAAHRPRVRHSSALDIPHIPRLSDITNHLPCSKLHVFMGNNRLISADCPACDGQLGILCARCHCQTVGPVVA